MTDIYALSQIASRKNLQTLAKAHNLQICNVSWEDTSHTQNSFFGHNIADMTLTVGDSLMPMIRAPNFAEFTADLDSTECIVSVGNEAGKVPAQKNFLGRISSTY